MSLPGYRATPSPHRTVVRSARQSTPGPVDRSGLTTVSGGATDVGRERAVNEDGYLALDPVFVVVDGMGGHAGGRLATSTALASFASLGGQVVTGTDQVTQAVVAAGRAVDAIGSSALRKPGATVAGVVLAQLSNGLTWVSLNVGDSRVYMLRGDLLVQVSHDHSQVQALIDAGRMTYTESRRDPRRHIITRALGAGLGQTALPELHLVPARPGDRVLVCSDGLSDELDDEALATVLGAGLPAQQAAEAAVAAALEAGGRDNVTALVVDLVEKQAP